MESFQWTPCPLSDVPHMNVQYISNKTNVDKKEFLYWQNPNNCSLTKCHLKVLIEEVNQGKNVAILKTRLVKLVLLSRDSRPHGFGVVSIERTQFLFWKIENLNCINFSCWIFYNTHQLHFFFQWPFADSPPEQLYHQSFFPFGSCDLFP